MYKHVGKVGTHVLLLCQVAFQGEVLAAIAELQDTYATLLDTQDMLGAVQQENSALKERCNEFVRANLDHMLAWRTLKNKADALEGDHSNHAHVCRIQLLQRALTVFGCSPAAYVPLHSL